ncbi:MAG: RCC1 domain-containing protein [Desulfuromonadaceae bacterium]
MEKNIQTSVSVPSTFKKKTHLFTSLLVAFLLTLPLAAWAATPWYSQGETHILTLTTDGKVWVTGGNEYGQLGNGEFEGEALVPTVVAGLNSIVAASTGGNHSVALKKDGTVWTWGLNRTGQLGNGTTEDSAIPQKVSGLSDVTAIATGGAHVVALKKDGTVWVWGGNKSGQLGTGEQQDCLTPTRLQGLENVTAIAAGVYNTSVLKSDGTVWSWGFNGSGQLGIGSNKRSKTPVQVSGLGDVAAITAGNWHVAALKRDGTVWTWGNNDAGQLGGTKLSYSFSPLQVEGLSNIADITASMGQTIAITRDNTVLAWGNARGNVASDVGSRSPVPATGYNGPVLVAAVVNPDTVNSWKFNPDSSSLLADAGTSIGVVAQYSDYEDAL